MVEALSIQFIDWLLLCSINKNLPTVDSLIAVVASSKKGEYTAERLSNFMCAELLLKSYCFISGKANLFITNVLSDPTITQPTFDQPSNIEMPEISSPSISHTTDPENSSQEEISSIESLDSPLLSHSLAEPPPIDQHRALQSRPFRPFFWDYRAQSIEQALAHARQSQPPNKNISTPGSK